MNADKSESLLAFLDRSPAVAAIIALVFGVLGYVLLSEGNILIGGFACWACGVNCCRAAIGNQTKRE